MKSRKALLALSTTELRNEIIYGVKLDRSWASEDGPTKTSQVVLPTVVDEDMFWDYCGDLGQIKDTILLPEVDLVFASFLPHKICCWSVSQKMLVWVYVIGDEEEQASRQILKFACDVSDDNSVVWIALWYAGFGEGDGSDEER